MEELDEDCFLLENHWFVFGRAVQTGLHAYDDVSNCSILVRNHRAVRFQMFPSLKINHLASSEHVHGRRRGSGEKCFWHPNPIVRGGCFHGVRELDCRKQHLVEECGVNLRA